MAAEGDQRFFALPFLRQIRRNHLKPGYSVVEWERGGSLKPVRGSCLRNRLQD